MATTITSRRVSWTRGRIDASAAVDLLDCLARQGVTQRDVELRTGIPARRLYELRRKRTATVELLARLTDGLERPDVWHAAGWADAIGRDVAQLD